MVRAPRAPRCRVTVVKFLCPECERLINLEQFRLEGAALVVTCQKCGVDARVEPVAGTSSSQRVSAPRVALASTAGGSNVVVLRTVAQEAVKKAALAADEAPFAIPPDVCPRCIARRAATPECPHCGIRFEVFDEATVLPPKWLREAWVELLRAWGDEALHTTFRRKAQQADALANVGRLYRLRQAAVPDDPVVAEGLADIIRQASVPIVAPRGDEFGSQRGKVIAVVVALLMAVALFFLLTR